MWLIQGKKGISYQVVSGSTKDLCEVCVLCIESVWCHGTVV